MYSPRLYKYRDSYVLHIPTVHTYGLLLLTHTLLVQTHIHEFPPLASFRLHKSVIHLLDLKMIDFRQKNRDNM